MNSPEHDPQSMIQRGSMGRTSTYAFIFLLLDSVLMDAVHAGTPVDPKDVGQILAACLESNQASSTIGMLQCYDSAYGTYDGLLNQTYKELIAILDPASRDLLRDAQRAWLDNRKADKALWNGPWLQTAGTISRIEAAQSSVEAVRSRLLELRALQTAATPG